MKIKPPKKSHRTLFIVIALLLVAALAIGIWYYFYHSNDTATTPTNRPVNSVSYTPPTKADKDTNAQQKEDRINQNQSAMDSSTSKTIGISLSRVGQVGTGTPPVAVRSVVTGATSGTCYATFTSDAASFSTTFAVTQQATYSSCNTDVPIDSFASSGPWTLSLYASSGGTDSNTIKSDSFTVTK